METKKFAKNDSGFICAACGADVPPLGYTSRNHCPTCLSSLHLDINPGDRAASCGAIMDPTAVEIDARRGYIITHVCRRCSAVRRNKAAEDDSREKMMEIMRNKG